MANNNTQQLVKQAKLDTIARVKSLFPARYDSSITGEQLYILNKLDELVKEIEDESSNSIE